MTHRIFLITAICLLFSLETVPKTFGDWPQWRGPERNGVSVETDWDPRALSEGPRILWKENVGLSATPL